MTSDPNGCPSPKISSHFVNLTDYNEFSLDEELAELLLLENEKKYDEAVFKYLKRYDKESNKEIKQYIIIRLAWCYKEAGKKDFTVLLNNQIRSAISKDDELYASTLEAENILLIGNNDYQKAANNFMTIKNNFSKNESLYKYALFNLGSIYSFQLGNKEKGKEYFDELKTKYPDDELTVHSMLQLGEIDGYTLPEPSIKKAISNTTDEPIEYSLSENYPNPFNPTTKIGFSLPSNDIVKLKVFDILGREIAVLADNVYEAGKYEIEFNASNLPSGVYFYNLTTGKNSITKKMLFLK